MSRRIIATDYVSLDGVIQDPVGMEGSGLGDWTGPFTRGPEGDKFKLDELTQADALLFGRLTYDGFAAVWPTVKDEAGFAERNEQPAQICGLAHAQAGNVEQQHHHRPRSRARGEGVEGRAWRRHPDLWQRLDRA